MMLRRDYALAAFDGETCHHVGVWQHHQSITARNEKVRQSLLRERRTGSRAR